MKQEIVKVTPQLAAKWLERNKSNRGLRARKIQEYVSDMQSGKWHLSPQGIMFNEQGDLIDGQHRLNAIIKSGKTLEFVVWTAVPEKIVKVIDSGAARSLGDYLHYEGVQNSKLVAAITVKILAYLEDRSVLFSAGSREGGSRSSKTRQDAIEYYMANFEKINNCASFAKSVYGKDGARLVKESDLGFAYWIFGMNEDANSFLTKIVLGYELKKDSSLFLMRRILEEVKNGTRRHSASEMTLYWLKAWEKRNESITRLVIK